MAPELLSSMDADELFQQVDQIRLYQEGKKWSDSEMLRKFAGLGSTKTYRKILNRNLDEVDVDKQLTNYRAVASLIESAGDADERREVLYPDLIPALQLKSAFLDVMKETGDARFVLMLGESGAGKTSSRRLLIEGFGQRILWTEASVVWNDRPMVFLGEILYALGERNPPHSAIVRMRKVKERLQGSRVCLVVDEGHHLGPDCLGTIKTLLNDTPGEIVVLALYTLWKRLEREAYEEVKQLTGNRLAQRIQLRLEASDVLKMLQRRIRWVDGEADKAVRLLAEQAPRYGNLAFVREVCKQANELAAGDEVDLKLFSSALSAKGATR